MKNEEKAQQPVQQTGGNGNLRNTGTEPGEGKVATADRVPANGNTAPRLP